VAECLFTGASALCGVAGSLTQLVIFRLIQGAGGGLMVPVGQAMLFRTFPPERRARAAGMVALGTTLGPATGPLLGGIPVTELSWRWCFYVNVPLGAGILVTGLLFLAEHREPAAGRLDVAGFLLSGLGSGPVPVRDQPGVGCGLVQSRRARDRRGRPGGAGRARPGRIAPAGPDAEPSPAEGPDLPDDQPGVHLQHGHLHRLLVIMPEFLQQARGATALSSGLTTLPGAIGLWLNAQIASRVYPRAGPRRMALAGFSASAIVIGLFGMVMGLTTNVWLIRGLVFLSGSGLAWTIICVQAASFATIRPADTGRASALFNTQVRVAGGIGVAILAAVASATVRPGTAATPAVLVGAYHHAFLAAAALILAGGVIALSIRDPDAASTMRPRRPPAAPPETGSRPAVLASCPTSWGHASRGRPGLPHGRRLIRRR
jgi:MFS family permease